MSYIVWINDNEQWLRSPELDNLDAVLAHVVANAYGHEFEVTKKVDVQLIERPKPTAKIAPPGIFPGEPGYGTLAGQLVKPKIVADERREDFARWATGQGGPAEPGSTGMAP